MTRRAISAQALGGDDSNPNGITTFYADGVTSVKLEQHARVSGDYSSPKCSGAVSDTIFVNALGTSGTTGACTGPHAGEIYSTVWRCRFRIESVWFQHFKLTYDELLST